MRIIILGAGSAGQSLAEKLCAEKHDVVVIEKNPQALSELDGQLDIQVFEGEGSSPRVLLSAGIEKADLFIAVTNDDESNIIASIFAHAAGVPHKVARVSNPDYLRVPAAFDLRKLGIDLVISQKEECAREIYTILRMPGTLEAVDMLNGRVLAVGVKVHMDSPLIMSPLNAFPNQDLLKRIRFIADMRGDELFIPRGDTQFMIGDDVYLAGRPNDVSDFLEWASPEHKRFEKVIIAGGGDLGLHLAKLLEDTPVQVVLIEKDISRAEDLAQELNDTLVLRADALEQETLENAGVIKGTAVVATTGSDENNIMISLLAEKAGANFTLAQVSKPEYVPIIDRLSLLDRAVSSHMSMINAILHFIRGKNVKAAALLHKLPGELLEVSVTSGNRWAGKPIKELRIPEGIIIATVLRDNEILAATGDLKLMIDDRLVVFAMPQSVGKIESIFRE